MAKRDTVKQFCFQKFYTIFDYFFAKNIGFSSIYILKFFGGKKTFGHRFEVPLSIGHHFRGIGGVKTGNKNHFEEKKEKRTILFVSFFVIYPAAQAPSHLGYGQPDMDALSLAAGLGVIG